MKKEVENGEREGRERETECPWVILQCHCAQTRVLLDTASLTSQG